MEKNKNILVAVIFVAMAMFIIAPLVSAAALSVTWNSPANYSNLSTSFTYNCTTSAHNVVNVSVYANSSSGTMNLLQTFTNTSAGQTAWTGTVLIQSADDGNNQNLTCFASNSSAATAYSDQRTASHISLDSTAPTCSMSLLHNTIAYAGLQKIIYSSSDTNRRLTTVDVDGPENQVTVTSTNQNGPLELGSSDTKYIGSWTVNMTVSDWAGNTCTDGPDTFKSYLPDGQAQQETTSPQNSGMGIVLILVIVGLIWYFVTKKK